MLRGVTSLGRQIAGLPVHPRIGRLLIEGAAFRLFDRRLRWRLHCFRSATRLSGPRASLRIEDAASGHEKPKRVLDRVHAVERFEEWEECGTELGTINRRGGSIFCGRGISSLTAVDAQARRSLARGTPRRAFPTDDEAFFAVAIGRVSGQAGSVAGIRQPPRLNGRRTRGSAGR